MSPQVDLSFKKMFDEDQKKKERNETITTGNFFDEAFEMMERRINREGC